MKPIVHVITALLAAIGLAGPAHAQTTVADGNWSDPLTWGGVPPLGTGTVTIDHEVTLDMDYSHYAGSITINASGALNGNSPMRLFALNYPAGTAALTVHGSIDVGNIGLFAGTVLINGTLQADSLLNISDLTIAAGALLDADEFMNDAGGTVTNGGSIASEDLLNVGVINNIGDLGAEDLLNSKTLTNTASGVVTILSDLYNNDTLAAPAVFTNDGAVSVLGDWYNGDQVSGSGSFCIGEDSWNAGDMAGTFDFCDQTGGYVDLNTGTIALTITFCTGPCTVGIEGKPDAPPIAVHPNPFSTSTTMQVGGTMRDADLALYDGTGREVAHMRNINGRTITLQRGDLPAGSYLLRLTQDGRLIATQQIVITD